MTNLWLYGIAKRRGLNFRINGKDLPVSLKNYEKLLHNGKRSADQWWYITQNWKKLRLDDEVLIYTGDDDRGIIGRATILGIDWFNRRWNLHLKFDLKRSLYLFKHPIPAEKIRNLVRYPRQNVVNLSRFRSRILRLLP